VTRTASITEAKAQLFRPIDEVEQGDEVTIQRSGRSVAVLSAYQRDKPHDSSAPGRARCGSRTTSTNSPTTSLRRSAHEQPSRRHPRPAVGARQPGKLSERARHTLVDPDNEVFVSAVTAWEISIRTAIGEFRAPPDLHEQVQRLRFRPLPMTFEDGVAVRDLPMIHRDPFDRLLIAQARARGLTLVTDDEDITQYDVSTMDA
jgi:prevent-host-death family protein